MRDDELKKVLDDNDLKLMEQAYPANKGYAPWMQMEGIIGRDLKAHRLVLVSMSRDAQEVSLRVNEFIDQLKADGLITGDQYESASLWNPSGGAFWYNMGYYNSIELGEFRKLKKKESCK